MAMAAYEPHDLPWLEEAACADLDLDLEEFFVEPGQRIRPEVLLVCIQCPVRLDCLRHAYRLGPVGGYFGGMSPAKRLELTLEEALVYDLDAEAVEEMVAGRQELDNQLSLFDDLEDS